MEIHESDVGKIVKHRLTGEKVIIIVASIWSGYKNIRIRRSDFSTVLDINECELEELDKVPPEIVDLDCRKE